MISKSVTVRLSVYGAAFFCSPPRCPRRLRLLLMSRDCFLRSVFGDSPLRSTWTSSHFSPRFSLFGAALPSWCSSVARCQLLSPGLHLNLVSHSSESVFIILLGPPEVWASPPNFFRPQKITEDIGHRGSGSFTPPFRK